MPSSGLTFHDFDIRTSLILLPAQAKLWQRVRSFQSHERYAELEAKYLMGEKSERLSRLDRLRKNWIVVPPMVMPIYRLLIRGLIFDGRNGWYYAFQRTTAEMMLSLRLLEHKLKS
jgi:hypothetical protein